MAFKNILAIVDNSPAGRHALAEAASVRAIGGTINVLYLDLNPFGTEGMHFPEVFVRGSDWDRERDRAEREAALLIERELAGRGAVVGVVLGGDPFERALDVVKARGVDLLVVAYDPQGWAGGSLGRKRLGHLLGNLPCDLLVVHRPGPSA